MHNSDMILYLLIQLLVCAGVCGVALWIAG